jgi:hypothetical protein
MANGRFGATGQSVVTRAARANESGLGIVMDLSMGVQTAQGHGMKSKTAILMNVQV